MPMEMFSSSIQYFRKKELLARFYIKKQGTYEDTLMDINQRGRRNNNAGKFVNNQLGSGDKILLVNAVWKGMELILPWETVLL